MKTATGRDCIPGVRRSSREGRYAERVLVGVDDIGDEERIVLWIERRPGAVWVVGRAVNPQLRESDEPRRAGPLVERLDVCEDLLELVPARVEEIRRQRPEHERVVGVRAVAEADPHERGHASSGRRATC